MANPPSGSSLTTTTHQPKNVKATTEIQEDPELWRDIQANVRKMDDLYDATFYTWLRSEDNVLVTASYLQRLAGEYDLDRIEHALCWLVNGWRLESIAILVKQVTFDWTMVKGDQGEVNRARLILALTDNWAIQYIARLACTLLTSATVPSPPPPLLKFTPCHSRMSSLPGSPMTSALFATDNQHPYGTTMSASSTSSPLSSSSSQSVLNSYSYSPTRSMALSTPSSPSSSSFSLSTPLPTHGRRMAVTRRLGSPAAASSVDDAATSLGRPMAAAGSLSPALPAPTPHRSGHYRQSSSTLPGQQSRPLDHNQQGTAATTLHYQSSSSVSTSAAAATHLIPQQASYHPHCSTTHHNHHHTHQQPHHQHYQLQHLSPPTHSPPQQPHPLRALAHPPRGHGTHSHARQQSQPGTISTSKQHWLQQQSSYSGSPVFYMNKSLFMEELSRKWSFCRLSEFFQCMDPASGITHRFKCKLLKESALKEELSQRQKLEVLSKSTSTLQHQQQHQRPQEHDRRRMHAAVQEVSSTAMNPSVLQVYDAEDLSMDVVMAEQHPSGLGIDDTDQIPTPPRPLLCSSSSLSAYSFSSSSSSTLSSSSSLSTSMVEEDSPTRDPTMLHPFDCPVNSSLDSSSIPRTATPMPMQQTQQEQTQYHSQQLHLHSDYNDDMNSGLSRGCKSADGNHQHCRAQTVEAIMSNAPGIGSHFSSSSSSSSPSTFSLTASSASASLSTLSTLTLAESGMESSSRPLSQPSSHQHQQQQEQQQHQTLSSFASNYATPTLYRHATTMSVTTAAMSSSTAISSASASGATATSSSSSTGSHSIHANGGQRHGHDSTSAKRKNSLGVSLTPPSHCSSFSATSSSSSGLHSSADGSLSSSSAIFPGPRRTSTSTSTTNEDLKRLRCSRQNSTSSTSGI
ncbi:hypothetical protein BGX28_006974 [Mortierella sp. GBA30]|nr:hypothetical protein BGX28_006974 [Mortierella sp. GBA30]